MFASCIYPFAASAWPRCDAPGRAHHLRRASLSISRANETHPAQEPPSPKGNRGAIFHWESTTKAAEERCLRRSTKSDGSNYSQVRTRFSYQVQFGTKTYLLNLQVLRNSSKEHHASRVYAPKKTSGSEDPLGEIHDDSRSVTASSASLRAAAMDRSTPVAGVAAEPAPGKFAT